MESVGGCVSRYLGGGVGWNMRCTHCTAMRGGGGGDRGAEVNRLLLVFPFCLKSGKWEHKQPVSVSHRFSLFLFFFLLFFSLIPITSFRAGGDISKNECKSTLRLHKYHGGTAHLARREEHLGRERRFTGKGDFKVSFFIIMVGFSFFILLVFFLLVAAVHKSV